MDTILIVGAGKSSAYLIETLLRNSVKKSNSRKIILADSDASILKYKVRNYPDAEIAVLDINNESKRQKLVKKADIVVSLMPPHLHILLAKDCLQFKKNLITSSYASPEMRELNASVKQAGLMFMCEMGLDPGIDHMTASHIFDSTRKVVSEITSFKSYCGGLIAPESDTNPWHYKFSWNPRNIINAGKDGARYLADGKEVSVPYSQIFDHNDTIYCEGAGRLAYYSNRDSLGYIGLYDLEESRDFMRATLRHPDFCKGWNALVAMGLTDTEVQYNTDEITFNSWMQKISGYNDTAVSVPEFTWKKYGITSRTVQKMIEWLEIFKEDKIGLGMQSSGDILLHILNDKWKMEPSDKDMVVMQHEVAYKHKGFSNAVISSMVVVGENSEFSAMAKTVGMPMAILTELILSKTIKPPTGVLIPTMPEVYRPVLNRLKKYDIVFTDSVVE